MRVQVITPEQTAFDGEALSLTVPTVTGEITVLAHHIPIITTLSPGTMIIRTSAGEEVLAVSRGVLEVNKESVRVLSDIADRAENLEEAAIEEARKGAEKLLQEKKQDSEEYAEALAVLDRELARLKSVRRTRNRANRLPLR